MTLPFKLGLPELDPPGRHAVAIPGGRATHACSSLTLAAVSMTVAPPALIARTTHLERPSS